MSGQLDALRSFVAGRMAAPNVVPNAGPQVLVVGSGKGGTGASVVAALLSIAAASLGRRVLLVDADPHVGPQRLLLGLRTSPVLADLRAGVDPSALAVPVSATLSVVAGGPGTSGGAVIEPAEQRALLRRVAALYPGHDLVVLDGGSRLDAVCACCEASAPAYAGATRLLVVTDTEPIALAASYALVKAARERTAAFPGGPVSADVVVNRHDEETARHAFAQIAAACREFLAVTPHLVGSLPDDGSLARALRAGMPLQDAAAGSPAAVAAQSLAERLLADSAGDRAADRSGSPGDRSVRRPLPPSYAPPFRSSAVPTGALR